MMHRDASQRLFFSTSELSMEDFPEVSGELAIALRLVPCGELVTDMASVIFRDYRRDQQRIELAWDNWFGFAATAKTPESEPLVQEIANWIITRQRQTAAVKSAGASQDGPSESK